MAFTGSVVGISQKQGSPNAALGYSATAHRGGAGYVARRGANWEVVDEPIVICFYADAAHDLAATGACIFIADDKSYKVVNVSAAWTVAENSAATLNLKLERCQGTEAAAAGDDLLAATAVNLKGTANTVADVTIITAADINVLADGDRLMVHFALDNASAQTPTELDGLCVTVKLVPVALSNANDS